MCQQADEAHIVNMSSMVGLLGLAQNASYSLTEGAVWSFSESLRIAPGRARLAARLTERL